MAMMHFASCDVVTAIHFQAQRPAVTPPTLVRSSGCLGFSKCTKTMQKSAAFCAELLFAESRCDLPAGQGTSYNAPVSASGML